MNSQLDYHAYYGAPETPVAWRRFAALRTRLGEPEQRRALWLATADARGEELARQWEEHRARLALGPIARRMLDVPFFRDMLSAAATSEAFRRIAASAEARARADVGAVDADIELRLRDLTDVAGPLGPGGDDGA